MIRKIFGYFCAFMGVAGLLTIITGQSSDSLAAVIGISVFFLAIAALCLVPRKEKPGEVSWVEQKKAQSELRKKQVSGTHMAGLSIAEGISTIITFADNEITMDANSTQFSVTYDKVSDVQVMTNVDIQKQYVSSIGGAVGGAVLFGPLGAMVGGRAKQKKIRTIENYLVITYWKDDTLDYISFKLFERSNADRLIEKNKSKFIGAKKIEL